MQETLEQVRSAFNEVSVCKRGERIDLDVEGATYATYHPDFFLSGYSWDALAAGCLLHPQAKNEDQTLRILLLGLGGGTVTRQLRQLLPNAHLEAVEIDEEVLRLARTHMMLGAQNILTHTKDAVQFLVDTAETWDVIVDDLYLTDDDDVIRPKVPDGEYLQLLCKRLAPGSVLLANVITDVGHHEVQARVRNAFAEHFVEMGIVTPPRGLNEIVVGGEKLLDESAITSQESVFSAELDREYWRGLGFQRGL
ncbi:MAG: hypothetical protein GY822_19955 [Deltaproteobacteria bacterium]|nr:hypothetical protein [Deltaproteobacteria bacterium]